MNLSLCRDDAVYQVGQTLTATWRISRIPRADIEGIEVSVLWYSEGKGDEDLHVHHFIRLSDTQLAETDLNQEQSIRCELPPAPLSYNGRLIRLQWCVRVRVFLNDGRESVAELPFHLVANRASDEH